LPVVSTATPPPSEQPGKVTVQLPSGMHVQLPADLVGRDRDASKPKGVDSVTEQALQQVLKGGTFGKGQLQKSEAARKAAEFAASLIGRKPTPTASPQDSHFTAELEINDYPQSARWKVTHKDAMVAITEFTGCAITARGQYCQLGKSTIGGERKLYLYIEGSSQEQVNKAKIEIKRILDESTITSHPEKLGSHARYSVL